MTLTRRSTHHNQICAAIVLSIVLVLTRSVCGRPSQDLGAFAMRQDDVPVPPLMEEILRMNDGDNGMYNELQVKLHRQQPNYLSKWPALRDLLLTATDYDDNVNNIDDDALNSRFLERLRQIAATSDIVDMEDVREDSGGVGEMLPTPMPQKKAKVMTVFKDHGAKKNVQYMSPCHFKICNMGRKRNARNFFRF